MTSHLFKPDSSTYGWTAKRWQKVTKFDGFPEKLFTVPRRVLAIGTKTGRDVLLVQLTAATTSPKTISMTEKIGLKNNEEADDNEQAEQSCKQSSGSISSIKKL